MKGRSTHGNSHRMRMLVLIAILVAASGCAQRERLPEFQSTRLRPRRRSSGPSSANWYDYEGTLWAEVQAGSAPRLSIRLYPGFQLVSARAQGSELVLATTVGSRPLSLAVSRNGPRQRRPAASRNQALGVWHLYAIPFARLR